MPSGHRAQYREELSRAFSSVQFSSVQFSSVQFSSVQFRSVQFSLVSIDSNQIRLNHANPVSFETHTFHWLNPMKLNKPLDEI
ncbi:hypothetical protein V1477_013568 [Vespula maculifrons]|uniref:Uncharacterized protein n=1 Tax=Vespula maculifrons TaxID=7453 RepID=A0ABD2BQ84_VESMC